MRYRTPAHMLLVGTCVAMIIVLLGARRINLPLTLEIVGFTNLPPTVPSTPLWTARDSRGPVSDLAPVSPSHVLFKVRNRTESAVPFRPLTYQFADSVPAGVAVPQGPSRHRGGRINPHPNSPPGLNGYKGMAFALSRLRSPALRDRVRPSKSYSRP